MVPAIGSVVGKVTADLAESNGSLPRLTACTPASAPGPTLGIEYRKSLPLDFNEARDDQVALASAGLCANHVYRAPNR